MTFLFQDLLFSCLKIYFLDSRKELHCACLIWIWYLKLEKLYSMSQKFFFICRTAFLFMLKNFLTCTISSALISPNAILLNHENVEIFFQSRLFFKVIKWSIIWFYQTQKIRTVLCPLNSYCKVILWMMEGRQTYLWTRVWRVDKDKSSFDYLTQVLLDVIKSSDKGDDQKYEICIL